MSSKEHAHIGAVSADGNRPAGRSDVLATRVVFDRLAAGAALAVFSPLLLIPAVAVVIEDGLPVLFRQTRVGHGGRLFRILKFRSMSVGRSGPQITAASDSRVTRVGRVLRRYKIDEFPQLWNVVRGEMSLVGPRPEVPVFVDGASLVWRQVLQVRPGITDLASLVYRDEERILAACVDPESHYRDQVLPEKLKLNLYYIQTRSFWKDLKLILWTCYYSLAPARFDADRVKREFCENTA